MKRFALIFIAIVAAAMVYMNVGEKSEQFKNDKKFEQQHKKVQPKNQVAKKEKKVIFLWKKKEFTKKLGEIKPLTDDELSKKFESAKKRIDFFSFSKDQTQTLLVTLVVNGEPSGEFLVERKNDEFYFDKAIFQKFGIPAKKNLQISALRNSVENVNFFPDEQRLVVVTNPGPQKIKIDKVFTPEIKNFYLKSVDYSLNFEKRKDLKRESISGFFSVTGAIKKVSFDITKNIGSDTKSYLLDTYSKDSEILKSARFESSSDNINSNKRLYLSNKNQGYQASVDTSEVVFSEQPGTKVDVFRNGLFLKTFTVKKIGERYEADLLPGDNSFVFKMITPNGQSKTVVKKFRVSDKLSPYKKTQYFVDVAEQNSVKSLSTEIDYGISHISNIFFGKNSFGDFFTGFKSFGKTQSGSDFGVIISAGPKNYNFAGSFGNQNFFSNCAFSKGALGTQRNAAINFMSLPLRPSVFYSKQENATGLKIEQERIRLYKSTRIDGFQTNYSAELLNKDLTSNFSKRINEKTFTNDLILSKRSARLLIEHVRKRSEIADEYNNRIEFSNDFETVGRVTVFDQLNSIQPSLLGIRINATKFKHFNFNFEVSKSELDGTVVMLGISGSFSRQGISSESLKNRGQLKIDACEDKNGNGVCESNEPDYSGDVYVERGRDKKKLPAVFDDNSVTNLNNYKFTPGFETKIAKNIGVDGIVRGQDNSIRVPAQKITEVEGRLPSHKNGVKVSLYDASGKIIDKQVTAFGGWYLFYVPESKSKNATVKVDEDNVSMFAKK